MKKLLILPALFIIFISAASAQTETLVNTFTDSTQKFPAIARDAAGNFLVVWATVRTAPQPDKGDIVMQKFDAAGVKSGSEITVNTYAAGEQERPVLAMNSAGRSVIAWASYIDTGSIFDIRCRAFDGNTPVTPELEVNSTIAYTQNNPAAAIREDGSFVVVWDSWYQDGGDRGIYAQRFDAAGNKTGSEFRINTTTAYSQARPRVKYMSDGKFIVTWESFKQDNETMSDYSAYMRLFNTDASPATPEIRVNTYTKDYQWLSDLTVFDDNTFAVVWCSWEQDGDDGGIYIQRFNADGSKSGNETRVNKTSGQYQWFPRIHKLPGKKVAVAWSSWKQDGDREGVYAIFLDENNTAYTFETRLNSYVSSFQWEPDFFPVDEKRIRAVWSTWEQFGNDYDIVTRVVEPVVPYGIFGVSSYQHTSGTSTGKIFVHAVDSMQYTGHQYEVSFDTTVNIDSLYATIKDLSTNTVKVQSFPLNKGKSVFYITPVFDGCAVEFIPDYRLAVDDAGSYFRKNTNTNLNFTAGIALTGVKKIAPVDIILIWGSCDTLANGQYATPLDTALATSGQKNIIVPFRAWDVTQNQKVTTLIKEPASTRNNKWDPGEDIVFLTPPPYQVTGFNTHAQLVTVMPGSPVIMPGPGDTNFVLTTRPVTPQDKFRFTLNPAFIVTGSEDESTVPYEFSLSQNYPNPFNPATRIKFSLPSDGMARLSVYNILGEHTAEVFRGELKAGIHSAVFNAGGLASGIYFYVLEHRGKFIARKMQLVK